MNRQHWAPLLRRAITAAGDIELFELAKQAAQRRGDRGVALMIERFLDQDLVTLAITKEAILADLRHQERIEDYLSVQLFILFIDVLVIEWSMNPMLQWQLLRRSISSCHEAIYICHRIHDADCSAFFKQSLARALLEMGEPKQAVEIFQEALDTYRNLAKQNPKLFSPILADTLRFMGIGLEQLQCFDEAIEAYSEALNLLRPIAEVDFETYWLPLSAVLNSLGIALRKVSRYEEAVQAFREAIEIRRRVRHLPHGVQMLEVALPLGNLANTLLSMGLPEQAAQIYREVIQIYRQYGDEEIHMEIIANNLYNLGKALKQLEQWDEATEVLMQAHKLFEKLSKIKPGAFDKMLLSTSNELLTLFAIINIYANEKT